VLDSLLAAVLDSSLLVPVSVEVSSSPLFVVVVVLVGVELDVVLAVSVVRREAAATSAGSWPVASCT
jgi:hypothetical protein